MSGLTVAASALVAAGALVLYGALTRLFAALYDPSDVTILVACAAGGTAAGALLAHRAGWHRAGRHFAVALGSALGALLAVATSGALLGLAWLNLTLLDAALAFLTFAGIGAALAPPYALLARRAGLVAGAQLGAAGVAVSLSGAVQDALGPPATALLGAALCAVGGLLAAVPALRASRVAPSGGSALEDEGGLGWRGRAVLSWGAVAAGIVVGLGALPFQLATGAFSLDPSTANSGKALYASVQDPDLREVVVHTTWDGSGRTDVAEPRTTDEIKWLYLDGAAAGVLPRGGAAGVAGTAIRSDLGFVPFLLPGSRERVLVVGAGGGQEVLTALAGGAREIVATEASAGLVQAQARFATYAGGLFAQPGVRLVPEDGRAYLRSGDEQFDVIYLTLSTQGTAEAFGAPGGSYLYTVEAFDEYLRHLRQDGRLVVKLRDEAELLRAFNTAFRALTRRGSTPLEALRRMLAVNNGAAAERNAEGEGGIALPLLIVRKTPYLEDEARQAFEALRETPYPPIFVPHLEGLSPVLAAFAAEGLGPGAVEAQAPFRISPATDNSPFFFDPRKGIPVEVLVTIVVLALLTGGTALLSRRPGVESIEAETDVSGAGGAFLEDDLPWRFVAFAAAVGLGFALILYPLTYRLPLVVAQTGVGPLLVPALTALAAATGALLTLAVRRGHERPAIGWATLAAALLAVALPELLPMIEEASRGQPFAFRAGAAGALLVPFGLCAGVTFPAAVRTLELAARGAWATLLWGVTALALVCGALLALLLGTVFSFTAATFLGAALLFVAFLMAGLRWLAPAASRQGDAEPAAGQPAPDLTPYQRPA